MDPSCSHSKKIVYVNPNFKGELLQREKTFVNPHFQKFLDSNLNKNLKLQNPQIHINPKMINAIKNSYFENLQLPKYENKASQQNKYCKVNPKLPLNLQNNFPKEQKTNPLVMLKSKKPSHSLIKTEIIRPPTILLSENYKKAVDEKNANEPFSKRKFNLVQSLNKNSRLKKRTYSENHVLNQNKSLINSAKSNSVLNFVYISGEKYVLNGKTLKRIIVPKPINIISSYAKRKIVSQISIKGKTFIRKSKNLFVAKNTASKKLRKINIPCPIYRRFGFCNKLNIGKCNLIHDKKHVAICKKFLQGACKVDGCFLSHDISLEKMPTCKFYLEGCCARNDCPYLHVKLSRDSNICLYFLQGFCESGKECLNLHLNICPDFYKSGTCKRVKCLYPHKYLDNSMNFKESIKNVSKLDTNNVNEPNIKITNVVKNTPLETIEHHVERYFNKSDLKSTSNEHIEICNDRLPLGDLPSSIIL